MPEPILRAERFGYRYAEGERHALRGVSLGIESGSFVLVVGESGSGKSTLLRAACGLVPHFHGGEAEGELSVGGLGVREHGPSELAAVCGTLFQDPETQVVMGGVRAEIALPLEHRGEPPAAVARGVEEAALALGIGHLLDRRTDTLSGGELQRVALAAALAPRPALLLLDEPTSQLDPVAGDELLSLLRRLNEEWGTTVLLAEHRVERCLAAADRVLALADGAVACDADPGEFLEWAAERAPGLATPAARMFSLAGLRPLPRSVKDARRRLAAAGLEPAGEALAAGDVAARESREAPGGPHIGAAELDAAVRPGAAAPAVAGGLAGRARAALRRRRASAPALSFRGAWHELADGPAILRGIELRLGPGEIVALMGRNGAGKSTLLRHARGLLEPTRGTVERAGDVALLLQNPSDYLVHERVAEEAGPGALARAGLAGQGARSPRDLSGGERQRLALEVALGERRWAAVCLDEPTRGMDRGRKEALAARLRELARVGAAVLVATHDTEFAAGFARRVVLMGEGTVIADGPAEDVLAGGWHFATEVARVLDGAGGALTPAEGAALLGAALAPREAVAR